MMKCTCEKNYPACNCDVIRPTVANNPVTKPAHYTGGAIECIDAIAEATKDLQGIEAVCTGNVIKYVWRWKKKNGVQDLEKAAWYLERLINKLKHGENNSQ